MQRVTRITYENFSIGMQFKESIDLDPVPKHLKPVADDERISNNSIFVF